MQHDVYGQLREAEERLHAAYRRARQRKYEPDSTAMRDLADAEEHYQELKAKIVAAMPKRDLVDPYP